MGEAHPELQTDALISSTIYQVIEYSRNILPVIDDVNILTNPEIHQALNTLIDH